MLMLSLEQVYSLQWSLLWMRWIIAVMQWHPHFGLRYTKQ